MQITKPLVLLSLAMVPILACESDVEVSANYNVITQVVTGTAKVKGKSQTRQIMVADVTPDADGCITIEDQDCGAIKICGGVTTNPIAVTITCGDPLLLQVPESWTPDASSWENGGEAGVLLVEDMSGYLDTSEGPTAIEPGMKGLVVMADAVFPDGFDGTLTLALATGGDDPVGREIKAQDIIVVEFLDADGNAIGTPEIAVPLGSGPIDFATSATFSATVEADGASSSEDAGSSDDGGAATDDDGESCSCRSTQPAMPTLGLLLSALAALCTRRRRLAGVRAR